MGFVFSTNHEEQKRIIFGEAHQAISTGYASAIELYKKQKDVFIQSLNLEGNQTIKELMELLNQQIYNESVAELDSKMTEIFAQVEGQFAEWCKIQITGDQTHIQEQIITTIKNYNKKDSTDPKVALRYLSNKIKEDFELMLGGEEQKNNLITKFLQTQGINSSDDALIANMFGYIRRTFIQKYVTNQQLKSASSFDLPAYKQSLKGYLQEDCIEKAFNNIFSKYGVQGRATGSIGATEGHQIIYDLIIGKTISGNTSDKTLEEIANRLNQFPKVLQGEGESKLDFEYGGIQSKSWKNPFITNTTPNFNSINFGGHAELRPIGTEAYYWHAGVRNLMLNMADVIGRSNFLFATGSDISFTSDLLQKFANANYVLNFHKPQLGKISNPKVYMNIHEND